MTLGRKRSKEKVGVNGEIRSGWGEGHGEGSQKRVPAAGLTWGRGPLHTWLEAESGLLVRAARSPGAKSPGGGAHSLPGVRGKR